MIKIIIEKDKIMSFFKKIFFNEYIHILLLLLFCGYMIYSMFNVKIIKTEIPETLYKRQKHVYILDAGHGYNENDKCSNKAFYVEAGDSCFYEYRFNIAVLKILEKKLKSKGIFYVKTDSLYHKRDLSVNDRAKLINSVYRATRKQNITPVVFSIHANASTKNLDARGIELFTNIEKMKKMFNKHERAISDQIKLMNLVSEYLKYELPNQIYREKGERCFKYSSESHEGGVRILDATMAYTVLIEAGFYTNDIDRALLSSKEYQNKIANAIFKSISTLENIK